VETCRVINVIHILADQSPPVVWLTDSVIHPHPGESSAIFAFNRARSLRSLQIGDCRKENFLPIGPAAYDDRQEILQTFAVLRLQSDPRIDLSLIGPEPANSLTAKQDSENTRHRFRR